MTVPEPPAPEWAQTALRDLTAAAPPPTAATGMAPEERPPALPLEPDFDAAAVISRLRHGEPVRRRAGRWVHSLTAASRDTARLSELGAAARQPVSTGRRIAVTSARGGAGRTTVTLLIGSVLAARRDDAVLAVDTDPELGGLVWRAGVRARPDPAALAGQLRSGRATGRHQLETLMPRTPAGLWVLQSTATGRDGSTPVDVSRALARYFGITVLDCGGDLVGRHAPEAVLRVAHAAVLVAPATADGVRAAQAALDAAPEAARSRTVVALICRTPSTEGLDLAAAHRLLATNSAAVVRLPYDRHLAAGAPVDIGRIAEPTLRAATELAGLALGRAVQR